MTKHVIGIVGSLLGALAGTWLIVAPFALAYQNQGQDWIDATYVDFWTGIVLIVISLIGVISYTLGLTRELRSRGIIQRSEGPAAQGGAQPSTAGQGSPVTQANMEDVLMPLLTSMLRDMQEQQQRKRGKSEQTGEQHNDAAPQQWTGAERRQQ